ncbi:MAG: glutathione S-transferase N-terminal domain-containing protein [Gammaproteobacteria bacterium]|nr:glutathione S-transferase N-terminal domain-containing protein [Gammaproteobacteria bacterium]
MAVISNRRSVMTLFSHPTDPHSHRARIVLAEKNITYDVVNVQDEELPEDLVDLNPYNSIPTLLDRELVLYDVHTIMEYLDERFPHPPLMPVDPVSRARFRIAMYHIQRDWYSQVDIIEADADKSSVTKAKKELKESLLASADLFAAKPYFLSDEFSLVDCSIAPILWRLPQYGIDLPSQGKAIKKYADEMFARPSFKNSLTEIEQELRA